VAGPHTLRAAIVFAIITVLSVVWVVHRTVQRPQVPNERVVHTQEVLTAIETACCARCCRLRGRGRESFTTASFFARSTQPRHSSGLVSSHKPSSTWLAAPSRGHSFQVLSLRHPRWWSRDLRARLSFSELRLRYPRLPFFAVPCPTAKERSYRECTQRSRRIGLWPPTFRRHSGNVAGL
jgi:hypothetical protein